MRQLADWGQMYEIETPSEAGSDMGEHDSSDFQNLQRNKRSMVLDLKSDAVNPFLNTKTPHVIVENYRPDVKHRLGIDYDTICFNPRIVYASVSGLSGFHYQSGLI